MGPSAKLHIINMQWYGKRMLPTTFTAFRKIRNICVTAHEQNDDAFCFCKNELSGEVGRTRIFGI